MKMKKFTNALLILSIAVFLFGSGYRLGQSQTASRKVERPLYDVLNAKQPEELENVDFSIFWETWNEVEKKFIDDNRLDPQAMIYGATKGMVASLEDPYTFFLTPEENQQSKDDLGGKFEGIGAQLGLKNNLIVIIAPLKDSPALRAGVQSGDIVAEVDGESTQGWTLPQAVNKIRGEKGTKVTLTLIRKEKEVEAVITRDQIQVDSVELSKEQVSDCQSNCAQVAYLKLNQFGENTNAEWDSAVDKIAQDWKSGAIRGMVLDLRGNPGGFLESAVYLSAEFLPQDTLIVTQESSIAESRKYHTARPGRLLDIPLVVMINEGSASASEIMGGALRDYDRAVLVGQKSFGKGSVQEALDLSQGAGLHVTVAKWILPDGDWINGTGIKPQIEVENEINEGNTLTREEDLQLDQAIREALQ